MRGGVSAFCDAKRLHCRTTGCPRLVGRQLGAARRGDATARGNRVKGLPSTDWPGFKLNRRYQRANRKLGLKSIFDPIGRHPVGHSTDKNSEAVLASDRQLFPIPLGHSPDRSKRCATTQPIGSTDQMRFKPAQSLCRKNADAGNRHHRFPAPNSFLQASLIFHHPSFCPALLLTSPLFFF